MANAALFKKTFLFSTTITSGMRQDVAGYCDVSFKDSAGALVPWSSLVKPGNATYTLSIGIDGVAAADKNVVIGAGTTDMAALAIVISNITGIDAQVLSNGKLRIISEALGGESAITVADGVAGTKLLNALKPAGGSIVIETPVAGYEGGFALTIPNAPNTTRMFKFVASVFSSAGLHKAGYIFNYVPASKSIVVTDNADTKEFAVDDVVTIVGSFEK